MIVGRGMIGSYFNSKYSNNNHIIFASGVSNSMCVDVNEYKREFELIKTTIQNNPDKKIIYFSSVFVGYVDNMYYKHKQDMENYILTRDDSLIFRIPQLIGHGGNSKNLFNYLKQSIQMGSEIRTNSKIMRAFLDISDLFNIVNLCSYESGILTISYIEKIKVLDICKIIAKQLKTEERIIVDDSFVSDEFFPQNSNIVDEAINKLEISKLDYNERVIRKYL